MTQRFRRPGDAPARGADGERDLRAPARPGEGDAAANLVLVIAAEPLLARGLAGALEERGYDVERAATAAEALNAMHAMRPRWSVIVLDPPLPGTPLDRVCERLIGEQLDTAAIVLVRRSDGRLVSQATRHGARGVLHTDLGADELAEALERVAASEVVIDPALFASLASVAALRPGSRARPEPELTRHQISALRLVAEGRTSKEIASTLGISPGAADHAIERATARLGASHRSHAVALAIRSGLFG